jgi:autotransporter passenger strand-loop-strand repeat protein
MRVLTMTTSTISSGQSPSNLVASGGNLINVLSGGTIISASILSGGSATIQYGGVDSGSTVSSGGAELVLGSATGDIVAGSQTVSVGTTGSGIVTNETVVSGGVVYLSVKATSASGTTVDSGGMLLVNGNISTNNTVLSGGGIVDLESAKATLTGGMVFAGGGTLEVTGNTSATYGDLAVISGFAAGAVIDITSATTLGAAASATLTTATSGGNTVATVSGGGVSDSFIFSGTTIGANLILTSDGAGGREITLSSTGSAVTSVGSGATRSNLVVSSGSAAALTVYSGGTIVSATILSGGSATISAGGVDSASIVSGGGSEVLLGSATGDSIFGTQTVGAATAVVSSETVDSGGSVTLAVSGATANGTTVLNGGTFNISGASTAINTTIAGGTVNLLSPQATLAGSLAFDGPGTLDIANLSSAGSGDQAVISGFYYADVVNLPAIGPGATLSTSSSGGDTVATVTSGGASETLTFAGSATSANLTLTSNGSGGEEIAYVPPPTTTVYTAGDLVLSIYGNGAGTGIVSLDQAAPITLEEITPSGQIVSQQGLPQTTTTVNGTTEFAISGEYESASEGLLSLAGNGQSITIMGYGVTAAAFDAAGAATIYGTTALGQTTSLIGGQFTTVPRVVADIGYNATVDTSTSISGIFNTNNPRSVVTLNGTTFYLSGQGNGADGTEGVFVAADGASSATAIYNTKTDTRDALIYNGQLYVSVDSKLNGGGGIYDFGATLPTAAATPSLLAGIGSSIVLTAGQANSVNAAAVGTSVNLSPEQYFFADPTTLYVADSGNPKEGGLGDGGLQKWSLVSGTWVLDYTLSLGLNQIPDTAASGTTGLVGLTGTVEGGNVILYASNETVAETDQTYLYAITDTLDATTLPANESFTLLETAAPDTLIRGVSFAPTSASTTFQVSTTVTVSGGVTSSGLTVTSGGDIIVLSGGTISATTLLSGASATVSSGGVDSATFVAHGGSELILGSASLDTIDGVQTVSNATAVVTSEIIENGGSLDLYLKGAVASATTVMSGGALNISGNAYADNTVISGGSVVLQSPKAVVSGSLTFAANGGTLEVTSVTSAGYGDLAVISGFAATDVIDERVMGSGSTLSTTLSGGNTVATVSSGSMVESFTLAGSSYMSGLALTGDGAGGVEITYTPPPPVVITVSSGVTSSGLSIGSNSTIVVLSGGTISNTTLLSGGSAVISAGGIDSATTIMSGGFETVSGSATGDHIYGVQDVTTGPSLGALPATISNETVYNGGTVELYLKPDTATNVTLSSGGEMLLSGNVSGTDLVLANGGYIALQSPKATLNGTFTFSGAATIAYTAITSAGYDETAVISGWGPGDVIDETLISSSVATLTTSSSGGVTTATISGATFPESFMFGGSTTAANISLVPDGGTGVELVYVACYRTGTLIRTDRGEVAIEELRAGDRVASAFGGTADVVWLGHRRVDCRHHPRPRDVWPVRIAAAAFGDDLPRRDLWLSPDHAVYVDGVLIPVRYLVNDATITQEAVDEVMYWHVELPAHDVIFAEGLPAESYLDTGNRAAFANGEGPTTLHPDFAWRVWEAESCAALVVQGAALVAARGALLARAEALGHATTRDAALRLIAGGRVCHPVVDGRVHRFHLAPGTDKVRLVSRTAVPAALFADSDDHRRLGVAVSRLTLDGQAIGLTDPRLGDGWHAVEAGEGAAPGDGNGAAPGWCWTDGDTGLTVGGGSVLEVEIAFAARYWLAVTPAVARVA